MAEAIARWIENFIATALPSGGQMGLAAVVFAAAAYLFKFASERASARMKKLFDGSWQAVAALALAGGGFIYFSQPRYSPLILALIAAVACLWASHSGAAKPDRSAAPRISRFSIRGVSLATLILVLLVPVYAVSHVVEWRISLQREARLQEEEGQVIVAFVLPSYKPTEDLTSADAEAPSAFEKRTFEQIYITLLNAAEAIDLKVEILPINISIDEFENLKLQFPPRTIDHPKLIQKLLNVFRDRSPIDIVLKSNLTVLNNEARTARFAFQAYELDRRGQELVLIDEFRHDLIGQTSESDVRRIALLAATEFSYFLLRTYPTLGFEDGFELTAELEQKVWDYYSGLFRQHYVDHVDYHRYADADWPGHALAGQAGPASYDRVKDWYAAFSEPPPDPGAEVRFNTQSNVTQRRGNDLVESPRDLGQR